MDFSLTDKQLAVRDMARELARRVVAPTITEYDRRQQMNPEVLPAMREANLLGFCIPEEYGGLGTDYISLGLASEELEYADTSARVILSVHIGLFSLPVLTWANEAQKRKYLVPAARGEKIATFGLTEPAAGSDAVGIQSTAVRRGDHYVLNGEKMWISLADVADQFLVFAWTDLDKKRARDHSGLSAFIVERGWEGVSTGSLHGKLGVRAGNTGYLAFADVRVPAENLVYGEGQGFKIAMFCLDQGRYTVAAGSCGLIRACRDASVAYALDRRTFEQPIGEHQLVKQMIANMEAGYEYCTYLWMKAGWLKNRGVRSTKATSLAKWIACREAEAAAANAVQVFGAYGFSDEYPVERFYRNAKGASIYEGTREIHTLMQADYALGFRSDKQLERDLPEAEQ
ncbi:MAG TPA: acyl-CoA dehydrogenase family protein [candidate division Zixibacteria bacterium]|nr:acyl-CoA dehydrogenase family protein [candidate division Zixibacteria bacterium]MDM7973619.1 acyl-CoA dehydrogenase family protein [candidate division Zixibacteria bacterium]HOD66487.1 acyl-CoA dehydrogenase family protein [candidate division Zixibacteria bacterium]HPI32566.1 acyl-CoA dehydrogenase family protein [candidate division Zixibacteria bacterium]HPM38631.1 acyl-CoA dehydrogenase family protein [candidate division Zixibacteria bacterium]